MHDILMEGYKVKKLLVFLVIFTILLPSAALANDMNDRIQIQGDVEVLEHEIIGGDAIAIMGDVTVDGKVMGDVVANQWIYNPVESSL